MCIVCVNSCVYHAYTEIVHVCLCIYMCVGVGVGVGVGGGVWGVCT